MKQRYDLGGVVGQVINYNLGTINIYVAGNIVYLLAIYDKSEQENISDAQILTYWTAALIKSRSLTNFNLAD